MMPDFFDTVNLLLEAEMGLDLALDEVTRKTKGRLSEEFLQTLEDMKLDDKQSKMTFMIV